MQNAELDQNINVRAIPETGEHGCLSEKEISDIQYCLSHFDHTQPASIDALKVIQKHRGWVSDEAIKSLATYLKISVHDLDAVATFYNLIYRKPVGKKVIRICNSVSCWIMGYEDLSKAIKEKLNLEYGETSDDGVFTLLPGPCLGACDCAPALMINDEIKLNVDISKLDDLLRK